MIRFLADENFNRFIVDGVARRYAGVDIVRVQDVGLSGEDDPAVLQWAASNDRVLLTHDVRTMTRFAFDRVAAGLAMPGVFEVRRGSAMAEVIDDIILIATCSEEGEWEGQVRYLPLE